MFAGARGCFHSVREQGMKRLIHWHHLALFVLGRVLQSATLTRSWRATSTQRAPAVATVLILLQQTTEPRIAPLCQQCCRSCWASPASSLPCPPTYAMTQVSSALTSDRCDRMNQTAGTVASRYGGWRLRIRTFHCVPLTLEDNMKSFVNEMIREVKV